MAGIFISYRRSTSSTTTYRLVDDLRRAFGPEHIFLDVESIEPGIPFAQAIQKSLAKSSLALIMIDPEWVAVADKQGNPRLRDPHDWVRQEVRAALASGARVIPVLIEGAQMPEEHELPDDIAALAQLQAFTLLPSQTHWAFDVKRLIDNISAIDPQLKQIAVPKAVRGGDNANTHYSYKVIGGFALYVFVLLAIAVEGLADSDTILGAIVFFLVAGMLFAFGFLDVRNGLVRGKKGAITGMVLCALGVLGHSVGYVEKLNQDLSNQGLSNQKQGTGAEAQFATNTQSRTIDNAASIDHVDAADQSADRDAVAQPAAFTPANAPVFTGLWVTQDGGRLQIQQRDTEATFSEFNDFGGQVGQGAGTISDGQFNFNYYNRILNVSAVGTAMLQSDGTMHLVLAYSGQQFNFVYYRQ